MTSASAHAVVDKLMQLRRKDPVAFYWACLLVESILEAQPGSPRQAYVDELAARRGKGMSREEEIDAVLTTAELSPLPVAS